MAVAFKLGSVTVVRPDVPAAPFVGEVINLGQEDYVVVGISRNVASLPTEMPLVLLTPIGESVRRDPPDRQTSQGEQR